MIMKLSVAVTTLGIVGCVSAPVPPDRNPSTEASIRGAEEAGANGVPAARLHLQMAKDQETEAQKLTAKGDDRARLALARSQADAELALGLAREASVHAEATRAADDLKAVRGRTVAAPPQTSAPVRSTP